MSGLALSWSGGKDCCAALHALRRSGREPALLLTTVDEASGRVPHHWVPRELIAAQSRALGIPLVEVPIPPLATNEQYEERMRAAFAAPPLDAVREVAFGDLFLEDLRVYREEKMAAAGRQALFPLWGLDTAALAARIVDAGFEAVIVSVDPARLDRSFLGRRYDPAELPDDVDPCGENGELHTFVHDGPGFLHPVAWAAAGVREVLGFPYLDLRLP
ncbi:MAG TPA: ATP-binding protein [Solirubrobacteraceae bacterium]|nr:ATP-binding protein [Solirubrobacteraceae bacterium]